VAAWFLGLCPKNLFLRLRARAVRQLPQSDKGVVEHPYQSPKNFKKFYQTCGANALWRY